MKYVLIQPDGMADEPLESLQDKTPLAAAYTPNMDKLASLGKLGKIHTIPEGFPPGSDIGNLVLIGHDPHKVFTGRAPLEAAAQGIPTGTDDVIYRVNLVTIENGTMVDFTAGHITSEEGAALVQSLNEQLGESELVLFPGVSYRNLARWTGGPAPTEAEPPHNLTDQTIEGHAAKPQQIKAVQAKAREILAKHPVNIARVREGKRPATDLWFWGEGKTPTLKGINALYGFNSGTMITAVDLLRGIAKLSGMSVRDVEGATGFIDTNYEGKCQAALDAMKRDDFTFVHIEAPDESAHMGRADYKIRSIEDIDAKIVGPIMHAARTQGDVTLVVLPDHPTLIRTKTHSSDPVPCIVATPKDLVSDGDIVRTYTEDSDFDFEIKDGWTLLKRVCTKELG